MVKLTVIYNLPEGSDHEAFLKWRTTEHQEENMGIPGVIRSDFYAVEELYTHDTSADKLEKVEPRTYRYMTEAYWETMDSFRGAFFDSGYQEKLMESLKKITRPLFFISREVLSDSN